MSFPSKRAKTSFEILRFATEPIPRFHGERPPLSSLAKDLNHQNIPADNDSNVVGFIDWDSVRISPNCREFARYPSWITRNWDPVNYGYSEEEDSQYESSSQGYYATVFEGLVLPNFDARHTRLPHLTEAISIGMSDSLSRGSISVKLLDHAFNSNPPFELFDYVNAYMKDATSEMDKLMKEAFKNMWHAEWGDGQEGFQGDDQAQVCEST